MIGIDDLVAGLDHISDEELKNFSNTLLKKKSTLSYADYCKLFNEVVKQGSKRKLNKLFDGKFIVADKNFVLEFDSKTKAHKFFSKHAIGSNNVEGITPELLEAMFSSVGYDDEDEEDE